ncbi:MAG: hypothetical protein ACYCV4_02470 [Dermatophilaceae bacterium]
MPELSPAEILAKIAEAPAPKPELRDLAPFELAPGQVPDRMHASIAAEVARQEQLATEAEKRQAAARKPIEVPDEPVHKAPKATLAERIAAELLISLKRQPTDYAVSSLTASGAVDQVAGRRVLRDTLSIFNGSASIVVGRNAVDVANDTGRVMTIAAGGTLEVDAEAPLFIKAAAGTTFQTLETWYDIDGMLEAIHLLAREIKDGTIEETI